MSEPMALISALLLLDPNDLTEREPVQVNYEGENFLGKLVFAAASGQVVVRCLEKQIGVREVQQLEREDDTCSYNHV